MKYVIEVNGIEVKCDTPEAAEALALVVARRSQGRRIVVEAKTRIREDRENREDRNGAFLRLVFEAPFSVGVPSIELAKRLGLAGPRGLGVMYGVLERRLSEHGIKASDILKRDRNDNGERFWKVRDKAKFQEAMNAIAGGNGTK